MGLSRYLPLEMRRKRLLRQTPVGPLHDYLSTPFVDIKMNCDQVEYVAIDLETTGLDADRDHILSVGLVQLHGDRIELGTARHRIVSTEQSLPEESVVIHQLTDDMVARGEPITSVLTDLLQLLAGKVLLAHYAMIELGFLSAACQRIFGGRFLIPVVDTFELARRQMWQHNEVVTSGALRLGALREKYHLPRYKAHNALSDAVGAAELFLAQVSERCGSQQAIPLKRLLCKI